jgi:hypothetical protein
MAETVKWFSVLGFGFTTEGTETLRFFVLLFACSDVQSGRSTLRPYAVLLGVPYANNL